MCFISGLASHFPEYKVNQEEIINLGEELFAKNDLNFQKLSSVYSNSGVNTRYLVNSLDWYKEEHTWKERNFLFKKNALGLLENCVSETLEKANQKSKNIGGIIVVNSTGILTPTLDAELINLFDLNNSIRRLPIFGFGCAGGVMGLNRAIEMYKNIKMPVLVCNVELCSLTFRPQIVTKSNVISTALFGDGAASYLVGDSGYCEVNETFEYTWKNSLNFMGWEVENDGLAVVFDKVIPEFVKNNLSKIISSFNKDEDIGYILHGGGTKILKAYESIFNNHYSIMYAKKILERYGNVSSVSVLLALDLMVREKIKGKFLMIALGPGFSTALSKINLGNNDR